MNHDANVWAEEASHSSVWETSTAYDVDAPGKQDIRPLEERTWEAEATLEKKTDFDEESAEAADDEGNFGDFTDAIEDEVPVLDPLLEAVFASDVFPSPSNVSSFDTNGLNVPPLTIDSTAATWTRLTTLKSLSLIRFNGSAIQRDVKAIVERWLALEQQQKPSWTRPHQRNSRVKARESIGAAVFGWTSTAVPPSSRGSSRSGAVSRGGSTPASTPLTAVFSAVDTAAVQAEPPIESAMESRLPQQAPAPKENTPTVAAIPVSQANAWDLSFFEKPVTSAQQAGRVQRVDLKWTIQ
ncbi:hypothetical protein BCR37DRAFT_394374 [Protomyces lactucae-debilis]|uniref:Uncharacterized protein n=1 Tax=Protomyces lactucae-debilis TaxID=2754530 RepID=A0A1Y2F592_PROLT|nr:uncharacterized protein BCR37DRAFT_394374 [Protomyces lactucae-debilis]ORY79031.1 hypothetical protein BCR37DRAFT_394374 [Protomyces lactucae-debilis]